MRICQEVLQKFFQKKQKITQQATPPGTDCRNSRLDICPEVCYTSYGFSEALGDHLHGGGCFPLQEGSKSFLPSTPRGGGAMYITLSELVAILSLLVLVAQYINNHNKKR